MVVKRSEAPRACCRLMVPVVHAARSESKPSQAEQARSHTHQTAVCPETARFRVSGWKHCHALQSRLALHAASARYCTVPAFISSDKLHVASCGFIQEEELPDLLKPGHLCVRDVVLPAMTGGGALCNPLGWAKTMAGSLTREFPKTTVPAP